jgi:hypothetical protein
MGKYKAFKKKTDAPPQVKPGVPCLIIIVGGMIFIIFVMIMVMKDA